MFILFVVLLMSSGQLGANSAELPESVLAKMVAMRQNVTNFQCTVRYSDFRPNPSVNFGHALNGAGQKLLRERLTGTKYMYQEQKLAFDSRGRARVELLSGASNPAGDRGVLGDSLISVWDGETAVEYVTKPNTKHGDARLDTKPQSLTASFHRQPWTQFGGNFVNFFKEALTKQYEVAMEMQRDGTYRIAIKYGEGRSMIAVVDPKQGYSVTVQETYQGGELIYRATATFEEVTPDLWFPFRGETVLFDQGNPRQIRTRSKIEIDNIRINDPNLCDELFHVDLPIGTVVSDIPSGLRYTIGEPMSEEVPGSQSTGEVASEMLEEMVKEINQKDQRAELFIPKVNIALKKAEPFVLDFANVELVNPGNKPESQESDKFLRGLGKGDIAWDGTIIAARGAKVLTVKQESKRPLKLTKGKWTGSYKLPEKVELPYSILVVTNEGVSYFVTVKKIDSGGMTIAYRKLDPDEVKQYKREPEDS